MINVFWQNQPIKYAPIDTALKKPHLMILGETGSGKSTICKYLLSQVNAPCIIIDPHAAPSDWVGFNVVGSGRNYDAIATEFERLSQLMQTRYEARDKGQNQFDTVIVIIDEFPAIASALGKDATDTVKLLAREARKVQIRMCLLSQGAEVKTLGIDGEGSIRECFAMLRLGNFALTHAKSLKDKSISDALGNCDRPAMLDQTPCNLPVLSDRQSLPVLPLPRDYQALMADGATTPIFDTMDRPNQQQSASTALSSSTSALSTQNQVSAPLRAIIDYAKRKNDYVSARQIQSGIAMFKTTKADEIRHYFQWLADHGYGSVRGGADTLEFSANP
ncbi:MAG: helicase HerA domain-containing protein [Pseudanabaenaceae cyanobacterium]